MPDRTLLRVGGGAAMIGAAIALVFNLLHPRSSDAVDSVRGEIELVADSDIWLVDHFMLAWGAAFSLVGFVVIARSFEGSAASWGRLALASTVASIAVTFVTVVVDGMAMKEAADNWAAASGADQPTAFATAEAVAQVGLALFTTTIGTLFGVTPVLFGVAGLMSAVYPRWMSYGAIGAGILGLLTASIQFLGGISALTANVLFPISSLAFTLWLFGAGWLLWKRAAAPAATPVPAA